MKKRALTIVELTVSLTLLLMGLVGFQMLFAAGLRSTLRTNASAVVNQENAQGIRRVINTLNEAMSASITEGGTKISYVLPKKSSTNDSVTGQPEILLPLQSDGVTRFFHVTNGRLVDQAGKVYARDLIATDPDPNSSQYGQSYAPFQFTTVGGNRAITTNFVTAMNVGKQRYARMKSTVLLRNAQ